MKSKSRSNLKDSKSSTSSEDSSDERNEAIIEDVFAKYANNGRMTRPQFSLVIVKLSKYVEELKGLELETVEAAFNLFSSGRQFMTLEEFKQWWSVSDKFSYFVGKKSRKISKAYRLYKRYSSIETLTTSKDHIETRKMSLKEFLSLLEDLGIEIENDMDEFDQIDTDGDGVLSFKEFCAWLNWF